MPDFPQYTSKDIYLSTIGLTSTSTPCIMMSLDVLECRYLLGRYRAMATATQTRRQELPRITGEAWRQIVYQGPVRRCFFTSSRSTPGMEHMVFVNTDGSLVCDCISAHFRGTCAHKTVVAATLAEEAKRIAQAETKAEEEAERGWKLTAKGRRALEAWRAAQATREETNAATSD